MNPPFVYWANEGFLTGNPRYWVHDTEECRFAAFLEGHGPFVKMTNGDNVYAICRLCLKRFVPDGPGTVYAVTEPKESA